MCSGTDVLCVVVGLAVGTGEEGVEEWRKEFVGGGNDRDTPRVLYLGRGGRGARGGGYGSKD